MKLKRPVIATIFWVIACSYAVPVISAPTIDLIPNDVSDDLKATAKTSVNMEKELTVIIQGFETHLKAHTKELCDSRASDRCADIIQSIQQKYKKMLQVSQQYLGKKHRQIRRIHDQQGQHLKRQLGRLSPFGLQQQLHQFDQKKGERGFSDSVGAIASLVHTDGKPLALKSSNLYLTNLAELKKIKGTLANISGQLQTIDLPRRQASRITPKMIALLDEVKNIVFREEQAVGVLPTPVESNAYFVSPLEIGGAE